MKNNLFVAYIIGVAGVVLIISGVRGTTPLVTLGSLLRLGQLPPATSTPGASAPATGPVKPAGGGSIPTRR